MKTTRHFWIFCLLFQVPAIVTASTMAIVTVSTMPQDNWYYNGLRINGQFGAIVIGPDWNIYAATNNSTSSNNGAICVFSTNGTFIRQFGTNIGTNKVWGIAADSQTNIYVMHYSQPYKWVSKFDSGGNLLLQFSADYLGLSTNTGNFYSAIAVGKDDRLYVTASNPNGVRGIQVLDTTGGLLALWTNGTVAYFSNMVGIATMPNGQIALAVSVTPFTTNNIYTFSPDGQYLATSKSAVNGSLSHCLAATPDGLFVLLHTTTNTLDISPPGWGATSNATNATTSLPFAITNMMAIAVDMNGTLYVTSGTTTDNSMIFALGRVYGTDPPLNPTQPPMPYISSVQQRSGSPLIDIDYIVRDADSAEVTTELLAFQPVSGSTNIAETLTSMVKLTAFWESTETNLGPHIAPNVTHRVTWDASEAVTNFGNLQFEIMAKDERGLLGFHFITLPADGTNSVCFFADHSG